MENKEITQMSFNFDLEGVTISEPNGEVAIILTEKEFIPTTIYLDLLDITTKKTFRKYFKSEYERDKFKRKLKYSTKLMVLGLQKIYD